MSEIALLHPYAAHVTPVPRLMQDGEIWREAMKEKDLLRAALERAIDSSYEIGRDETRTLQGVTVNHIYTADFSDKRNLRFYDKRYMPRLREIVGEAKFRNMEPQLREIFTPEGLYAVKLGRTTRFSFNQLSGILFPQSQRSLEFADNVLPFPGSAP